MRKIRLVQNIVTTTFLLLIISVSIFNESSCATAEKKKQNLRKLQSQHVGDVVSYTAMTSMLSSSLDDDNDMGITPQDTNIIETLWKEEIEMEWERADEEEARAGELRNEGSNEIVKGTSSFLICNGLESQSGNLRIKEIKETISSLTGDNSFALSKDILYNKDDFTCMFSTMTASLARDINEIKQHILIQPIIPATKIRKNSIYSVTSNEFETEGIKSIVNVAPCSDIVNSTISGATFAVHLLDRIQKSFADPESRRLSNNFMIDAGAGVNRRTQVYQTLLDAGSECGNVLESVSVEVIEQSLSSYNLRFEFYEDEDKLCSDAFIIGLSTQPDVCSVSREKSISLLNDYAQWILQSNIEEDRSFWDAGITGTEQIVQVSDSGLDTDNCYFWDSSPGEIKDGTVQSSRRKVVQYHVQSSTDDTDTVHGHGTHVVGTILGKRSTDGTVSGEALGFADGVAINGKVAFFDIGNGNGCCYVPGASSLFVPGKDAGASLHSGSWGGVRSYYDAFTKNIDDFIHDDEDFIALFAAGNDGAHGDYTVLFPSFGKNVIAVGACESFGDDLRSGMLGHDYMADFSSVGPSFDGRIKPDIVAPGYGILSSGAQPSQIGECDPEGDRPNYQDGVSYSMGLAFMQGTSMATPAASGAALLIRQYLQDGFYPSGAKNESDAIMNPSGTLLKAILVNGGESLLGVRKNSGVFPTNMYDNHQGFGRVNLLNSLPLSGRNNLAAFIKDKEPIGDDETHVYAFRLDSDSNQTTCEETNTFSVSLVWADPPVSDGCGSCVVNDLDLLVEVDTIPTFPNGKNTKDSTNNVERVRVESSNNEEVFVVSVIASNLVTSSQTYSLVATGCGLSEYDGRLPTSAPEPPPPPTASPTDCINKVTVRVKTDDYGSETSWELVDIDNENNVVITNNEPLRSDTLYEDFICVHPSCYNYIIRDSYGDGICCKYGLGYYQVLLNDEEVAAGESFGSSESTDFCATWSPSPSIVSYDAVENGDGGDSENNNAPSVDDSGGGDSETDGDDSTTDETVSDDDAPNLVSQIFDVVDEASKLVSQVFDALDEVFRTTLEMFGL